MIKLNTGLNHLTMIGRYFIEKLELKVNKDELELFETITDFNLEARYPDEKFKFQKKCTKSFTTKYLKEIESLRKCLLQQITL